MTITVRLQLSMNLITFTELAGSLPCSQRHSALSYPDISHWHNELMNFLTRWSRAVCHLLILWLLTSRSIASTVTTSNCTSYCKLDQNCTSELIYYVNTRTYTTTEDRNPANNRINRPLSTVITWPGYATTNVKRAYIDCYPVIAQNIQ